jgi:hypothetical protein
MTPEDNKRIEEYTAEIAKILYRNAEAKNAERLKTPGQPHTFLNISIQLIFGKEFCGLQRYSPKKYL